MDYLIYFVWGTYLHLNVALANLEFIPDVPPGQVVATEWREALKGYKFGCHYFGLSVPLVDEKAQEESPAEPPKATGYAYLLNKRVCPGKEPEAVLVGYTWSTSPWAGGRKRNIKAPFKDLLGKKPEELPDWLPQVMASIKTAAATMPEAQAFLDNFSLKVAAPPEAGPETSQAQAEQASAPVGPSSEQMAN